MDVILSVNNLSISFQTEQGRLQAVSDLSFEIKRGKTLAIVGESGCGKSVTSLALMKLLPEAGRIDQGTIFFNGCDITKYSDLEMQSMRGIQMSMIFQEPMTALNPVFTIGDQIMEVYKIHKRWTYKQRFDKAVEMLHKVQIPDPVRRMSEYPFQMSGGMRQRVLIAMALACQPALLIADEPTTALDVTIQAQILKLIIELQQEFGTSVLFITHDLGVVAQVAHEVMVMYAGQSIERANVFEIYDNAAHPYTKGLLNSIPSLSKERRKPLNVIEGMVPSLFNLPSGCRFRERCIKADEVCKNIQPAFNEVVSKHWLSCHHHELERK